jgi:hypothetical protein
MSPPGLGQEEEYPRQKPIIEFPFRLPKSCLQSLKKDLHTFHGLFHHAKCEGKYLEELLVRGLQYEYEEFLHWDTNSHSDEADIEIDHQYGTIKISVKSGKWDRKKNQKVLTISGFRLGRFSGDMFQIVEYLNSHIQTLTVAIPTHKEGNRWKYSVVYIDKGVIVHPQPHEWVRTVSKKASKQTFKCVTSNGIHVRIQESMSWQIWWDIPASLLESSMISIY